MKVSKKLQKKRKADKRTIGIVACVIVIAIALGVVIFLPSNNNNESGKNTTISSTTQTTNNNNIQNTNSTNSNGTNTVNNTTNTVTSNPKVTTNSNTIANNNQSSTNNNQTTNNNNNSQEKKEENNGWSLFNWGGNDNKDVNEDKAKEIAASEFAKLGDTVNKNDLTLYELNRNDGLVYYYIKSSKNTCEVRKQDGVVTRLNAVPVNQ